MRNYSLRSPMELQSFLTVVLIVAAAIVFVPRIFKKKPDERIPSEVTQMYQILGALEDYCAAYGELPSEGNLFRALIGSNANQQAILRWPANAITTNGVFMDPYGTPFRTKLSSRTMEIRSAGPDKTFGTRDDSRLWHEFRCKT